MKNIKKLIRNILFFIVLVVITFVIVFKNYNIRDTFNIVFSADIRFVLLAILCMCFYFIAEGLNNKSILSGLGDKVGLLQSIKYTVIGFFFSGITPAAGGGQPAQVYFMSRDGIPSSHGTLSLLVQLITFHAITLAMGIFGVIFNYRLLSSGMIILFSVGLFLKGVTLALMYVCFRNRYAGKKIIDFIFPILRKLKVKNIDEKYEKACLIIEDYNNGAKYIRKHKKIFIKSICIIFLQMVVYYTLPYFVYRSLGLDYYNWVEILTIQSVLYVSVASIPLPGSIGVSEGAFLSIYEYIFGSELLASAMILNRGISFYLFVIVGLIVAIITFLKQQKRNDNG